MWDVFSLNDGTKVLEQIDSIYILSDSVFWYKSERRESLFFEKGKEIDLGRGYDIRVMKPKYSDKSYIKIFSDNEDYIFTSLGDTLPPGILLHSPGRKYNQLSLKKVWCISIGNT